jgi:hypothetical protein
VNFGFSFFNRERNIPLTEFPSEPRFFFLKTCRRDHPHFLWLAPSPAFFSLIVVHQAADVEGRALSGPVRNRFFEEPLRQCVLLWPEAFPQVEPALDLADAAACFPEITGLDLFSDQARIGFRCEIEIHYVHAAGNFLQTVRLSESSPRCSA